MANLNNEFDGQNADLNIPVEDTTQTYIDTITSMKETMVSKEKYNEAIAENRKLIKALTNGETISLENSKPKVDIETLRKELFNRDNSLNNLQYVEKALELREALMENGEADPFLPVGSRVAPTHEEIETAENVAEIYRECIEYADGNSEVFTNELMRRTVDVMPNRGRRR